MSAAPEPNAAALLAGATSLTIISRKMIRGTDRTSLRDVAETLDALQEHLAVAGGSLVMQAERLGCVVEVEKLMAEGQARLAAYRAFRGTEGQA